MEPTNIRDAAAKCAALLRIDADDAEATIRGHLGCGKGGGDVRSVYGSGILLQRVSPDWSVFDTFIHVDTAFKPKGIQRGEFLPYRFPEDDD